MWGHCFTKPILTGVINQSNNGINLLSKATAIWSFEEGINSIDLFGRLARLDIFGQIKMLQNRDVIRVLEIAIWVK